jgi:2-polyprenyl-3-methyl-5-hydroxy-6-metoxy-1,4-benzoquinol methylase
MAEQPLTTPPAPAFDSQKFWEERLRNYPDITGVCYAGLSLPFVELQYRSRMRQLERGLRRSHLLDLSGRSVLDVGAGTGAWMQFWQAHGAAQVDGLDFAQPSVDQLKQQFPAALVVQADLSISPLPLPPERRYDIISAFHVLLHIADPAGLGRALANLAHHTAPGGWLIISDAIVQGRGYLPIRQSSYDKVWTLADYEELLKAHGFALETIRAETVLFDNPLEAPNRFMFKALRAVWMVTRSWGRRDRWSRLLGPLMLGVERLALGPSLAVALLAPKSSLPANYKSLIGEIDQKRYREPRQNVVPTGTGPTPACRHASPNSAPG